MIFEALFLSGTDIKKLRSEDRSSKRSSGPTVNGKLLFMTLAVNLFRVKKLFAEFGQRTVGIEFAEETAGVTGVAGGSADLFHLEDHSIFVAIDQYLMDDLNIAGAFALVPEFLAGTGEINSVSGLESFVP